MHANPPPEVVVTDTAATITTERHESSSSMTTTIETTVTKSSGFSSTITEVCSSYMFETLDRFKTLKLIGPYSVLLYHLMWLLLF